MKLNCNGTVASFVRFGPKFLEEKNGKSFVEF